MAKKKKKQVGGRKGGRGGVHKRVLTVIRLVEGLRFGWTLKEIQQEVLDGMYHERTIRRDISHLVAFGFVEKLETDRGTVYRKKQSDPAIKEEPKKEGFVAP